jgi:hypothetical protein
MPRIATTLEGVINVNRNLASVLSLAATAAAAVAVAIASGSAYADDITVDPTPFVSTKSRAEVRAELLGQASAVRTSASEWSLQDNQVPLIKSSYTSQQAMAEYKVSRDLVRALNGEDSGSAFFIKGPVPQGTATMGGPAR